jgi:hypothetical protein
MGWLLVAFGELCTILETPDQSLWLHRRRQELQPIRAGSAVALRGEMRQV